MIVGHHRWRLEWRDPRDMSQQPGLVLCRTVDCASDVQALAARLIVAGRAADGEFYVSAIDAQGAECARVLTTNHDIERWDPLIDPLPRSPQALTRWGRATAAQDAAARGIDQIRAQVRAVWKCGGISLEDAMHLVAEASRLLDPVKDDQ